MILMIRHLSGSLAGMSQRVTLQEGQTLRLGRAAECDLKFSDAADDNVSILHAELSVQGERLFIEDKRSSNGTFVDGAPCPPFQKVEVPDGSRIRLAKLGPEMQVTAEVAPESGVAASIETAAVAMVLPTKESVGRATMLREIDRARQEERGVLVSEVEKAKKRVGLWVSLGLVLLAVGGGVLWWKQAKLRDQQNLWSDVERKVGPAVVYINCSYRIHIPLRTGPNRARGELLLVDRVSGSGVLIRPGLILTAKHLVEPWRAKLKGWEELVETYSARAEYDLLTLQFPGQQPVNATLVAVAEQQDLALLQILPTTVVNSVPIAQSNSTVRVTDRIAIMGYPSSLGQRPVKIKNFTSSGGALTKITQVTPTFVMGTVSQPLNGVTDSNYMHFDASETRSNSGGAVVNERGELIGIVSAQFQQRDAIKAYGLKIPLQVPVRAGNLAVSPDDIQAFLRNRGIL
jgi:S1-C subfamily serine protease